MIKSSNFDLKKYQLDDSPVYYKVNKPIDKILNPYVQFGQFKTLEGVFLTLNEFEDSNCARQYLAITYTPIYELSFKYNDLKNSGFTLINPFGVADEPSRIWPAFGHYGGGWEIVLINENLTIQTEVKSISSIEKFSQPPGGIKDYFRFNSARAGPIIPSNFSITPFIENIIFGWIREYRGRFSNLSMKIEDDLGSVFSWTDNKKFFSISCAYKAHQKFRFSIDLAFWGYVWEDRGDTRYILKTPRTIIDSFFYDNPADATIDKLANRIMSNQPEFHQIWTHLDTIYNYLIELSKNFNRPKRVTLPQISGKIKNCPKKFQELKA